MHNYAYLIFNLLVFIPVLVLSLVTDVKPHKQWKALLAAYALVSFPFVLWDAWAVQAGHWGFNNYYVFTARLLDMPLEEILFFITVPFAMMYVWGVIKKHVASKSVPTWLPLTVLGIAAASATTILVWYWDKGYTRSAMIAALIAIAVVATTQLIFTKLFWVFQLVLLGIFLIANWVLTTLPIITYGDSSIIGTRVVTIPIEDFFFNFALINLFLVVYNWVETRTARLTK